jgi:hypothetical protein
VGDAGVCMTRASTLTAASHLLELHAYSTDVLALVLPATC